MQYVLQGLGVVGIVKLNENLPCLLQVKVNKQKTTLDATHLISVNAF